MSCVARVIAHPMRLKSLPGPDPPYRGRADPHRLGHHRGTPVGRLVRRRLVCQGNDTIDGLGRQWRDARGPGLVADQPLGPLMHEALLPAPDHGLALAERFAVNTCPEIWTFRTAAHGGD